MTDLKKLLSKPKRRYATVEYDGDEYRVRSLTMKERGENDLIAINLKSGIVDAKKLHEQKCNLLCLCVVDDKGNPLLSVDDWELWSEAEDGLATALLDKINSFDESGDGKDLEKNSEPTGD